MGIPVVPNGAPHSRRTGAPHTSWDFRHLAFRESEPSWVQGIPSTEVCHVLTLNERGTP